jgi:carbamoyl-phosphate synthase large subunit
MIRRRNEIALALTLCIGLALAGFHWLVGPMRDVEAAAVLALLGGAGRVSVVTGHTFQVLPSDSPAFRAEITPFCSSLVSVLALGTIAFFVLRGPTLRRISAFLVAGAVVVACNVLRIAASVWFGLHYGGAGLVLFHDWVGTLFGLAYTMGGFFLMLYLLLPSATAQIPRAARVSDVL